MYNVNFISPSVSNTLPQRTNELPAKEAHFFVNASIVRIFHVTVL